MDLEVRPFELVLEGDPVYLERDRERSLAFRLFRDGVRRLRIGAEAPWDERLRLLEILSIRYTGVRQQEDDVVTLLWKAGFKHIEIEAVEGVVLDGGEGGGGGEAARRGMRVEAPSDRDRPLPSPLEPQPLEYRALDVAAVLALRHEESSTHLAEHCLQLLGRILAAVAEPTDPMQVGEVVPLFEEIREFLLGEQQLSTLLELEQMIRGSLDADNAAALAGGMVTPRAIARIIRSIQHAHDKPPPELLELFRRIDGPHLETVLGLLEQERDHDARKMTRQLLYRLGEGHEELLKARTLAAEPEVAADLFRAVHKLLGDDAPAVAEELVGRGDPTLQEEILTYLQRTDEATLPILLALARSVEPVVRAEALRRLTTEPEARLYPVLLDELQRRPWNQLPQDEGEMLAQAMAHADPESAGALFLSWIQPVGLLQKLTGPGTHKRQQWVAVAGLQALPELDVDDDLKRLQKWAAEDLDRRTQAALSARRRAAHG